RGLAGGGTLGADGGCDPEPAGGVDAHRQDAGRARPALFALTEHAIGGAGLGPAGRLGRGPCRGARFGGVAARSAGGRVRRGWRGWSAGGGGGDGGGHGGGLSRDPGQARTGAADSGAEAGAGADTDQRVIEFRGADFSYPPGEGKSVLASETI